MLRSFILFAGLVLALGLAGCPQQAEEPNGDAEVTEEEVVIEEAPADGGEAAEEPASDAPADSGDDMTDDSGDDGSQ